MRVLPAGRSREPLGSLNRAGAIVWTRFGPDCPSESLYSRVLGTLREEVPIFRAVQKAVGFSRIDGDESLSSEELDNEPVGLMAAIARPVRLREDLEATGARIVWSVTRRDHHAWRPDEVRRLVEKARSRGARAVVTTGKDAVKMKGLLRPGVTSLSAGLTGWRFWSARVRDPFELSASPVSVSATSPGLFMRRAPPGPIGLWKIALFLGSCSLYDLYLGLCLVIYTGCGWSHRPPAHS